MESGTDYYCITKVQIMGKVLYFQHKKLSVKFSDVKNYLFDIVKIFDFYNIGEMYNSYDKDDYTFKINGKYIEQIELSDKKLLVGSSNEMKMLDKMSIMNVKLVLAKKENVTFYNNKQIITNRLISSEQIIASLNKFDFTNNTTIVSNILIKIKTLTDQTIMLSGNFNDISLFDIKIAILYLENIPFEQQKLNILTNIDVIITKKAKCENDVLSEYIIMKNDAKTINMFLSLNIKKSKYKKIPKVYKIDEFY